MEPIKTIEHNGRIVGIFHDTNPKDPREWDNLGTMVCWHKRYNLGDEQPKRDPEEWLADLAQAVDPTVENRSWYWSSGNGWRYLVHKYADSDVWLADVLASNSKIDELVNRAIEKNMVILPLYIYDHSGITINTNGFSCPWDSGQVGYIFVTRARIAEELGWKVLTKKRRSMVEKILVNEVEVYDQYLRNDVYGYMIQEGDDWTGGCWGYYGDDFSANGLISSATDEIGDGTNDH